MSWKWLWQLKLARLTGAGFSLLLGATAAAQVIEVGEDRVEFLGLRNWTVERVQAALEERQPGSSLHQCAAALKELGFADAAVMNYVENGRRYTVVTVVEPNDRDRVCFRAPIAGEPSPISRWTSAAELRAAHGIEYGAAVSRWLRVKAEGEDAVLADLAGHGLDDSTLRAVWNFLRERDTEHDFHLAVWTLAHDADAENRATAVALLLNFVDNDLAMWSLIEAVRDPAPAVRDACLSALWAVVRHVRRRVEWEPACASLRSVLGGTNLFAFSQVLQILSATEVDSSLTDALLADNAHLVRAYLGASHDRERAMARAFLSQLRGRDLGESPEPWNEWLDSLTRQ